MKIAIIGCGNMGSGFAHGLAQHHDLKLYDRDLKQAQSLAKKLNCQACSTPQEAIQQADWIVLAVKPQSLVEVSEQLNTLMKSNQVLISMLAGISSQALKQHFPHLTVIRIMPNLAVIYGKGVIGLVDEADLTKELKYSIEQAFAPLGKLVWTPESKIDGLTALTGSGPAFLFTLIESMIEAGITMGFSAKESKELVIQMMKGSLSILEETGSHPGELKWQITSPAGTTIAGIRKLEEEGIRGKLLNTFLASYEKAKGFEVELSLPSH